MSSKAGLTGVMSDLADVGSGDVRVSPLSRVGISRSPPLSTTWVIRGTPITVEDCIPSSAVSAIAEFSSTSGQHIEIKNTHVIVKKVRLHYVTSLRDIITRFRIQLLYYPKKMLKINHITTEEINQYTMYTKTYTEFIYFF